MIIPIDIQNSKDSKECPFYCKDKDGKFGCIIKEITSQKVWETMVDNNNPKILQQKYKKDCKGEFDNCCFVDLIWGNHNTNTSEVTNENPKKTEDDTVEIKVSIHKVENPYLVKSDVLIYPTNNLLEIDDILLNKMSRNNVQKECDKFKTDVKMGNVYITSNGGDGTGNIKAKNIYHAVVAGESRLVNESDIKKSIVKALIMADMNGNKIVSMLPADCGTYDIENTAFTQVSAIKEFLNDVGVENIEYIFIIMDDQDSYEIFIDQFSRIFNN